MSFFYPLCSSSKGNCAYVGTPEQGILVDAGIGIRNFGAQLLSIGVDFSSIQGIFITHEHSDHVKGLTRIQSKLNVPVYASKGTLRELVQKGILTEDAPMREIGADWQTIGKMQVVAFSTPHDAVQSQGYRIVTEEQKNFAVCTDLGHVPEEIHAHLSTCDLVFLESNYEKNLLQIGIYPPFLKRRIAGSHGHLSNEDCTTEINRLLDCGVHHFVLGHLSEENNMPDLAYSSVVTSLESRGAVLNQDFFLHVAPKVNSGHRIEIE